MPDGFTFLSGYLRAFLNERQLKVCLCVPVSQKQISYNYFNNILYFSFYYKDETIVILRSWTERREKWIRFPTAAFLKLWSAGHKWSSGSALVVLLD